MKRLAALILFGAAALLLTLPLSAMGADTNKNMKQARRGLVSDQIIGGVFAEDQEFWSINSVTNPVQLIRPLAWNDALGFARRPPINSGPWTPPPWWTPPRRPPWASPHR